MMAANSIIPQVKAILPRLTDLYLRHRTPIHRCLYGALLVSLLNRAHGLITAQRDVSAEASSSPASKDMNDAGDARGKGGGGRGSVSRSSTVSKSTGKKARKKQTVRLDRKFMVNLLRLLQIVVPGWKSSEAQLLFRHSAFLVLRTLLSVYVAELDGKLVSALVRGKGREFLLSLVWWMLISVPATFTNSMVCAVQDRRMDPRASRHLQADMTDLRIGSCRTINPDLHYAIENA